MQCHQRSLMTCSETGAVELRLRLTSVGEKWLETHVRSHIAFACARALRDICVSVVRAHLRPQIFESARAFTSANF